MRIPPNAKGVFRPSSAFLAAVLVFICAPLIALGQFVAHARTDEADGYLFACFGRELLQGAVLYRDVWDIKPPGIYWANALGLWLGKGSLVGVYALCAVCVCGSVALIAWIAYTRYGSSTACLAAIMAAVYLPLHDLHIGCNRPCTFYLLSDLVAFTLYLRAWRGGRPRPAWLAAAGIVAGLSICFRQTAVSPMIAMGLHLLVVGRRELPGWRTAAKRLAYLLAGWCTTVAAVIVAIAVWGDLGWAWDAIVAVPFNGIQPPLRQSFRLAQDWVPEAAIPYKLPLLLAFSVALHAALRRLPFYGNPVEAPTGPEPRGVVGLWWCWFIAALLLSLFGIAGRLWYLAPAVPPLLLLSAHAVNLLLEFGRRMAWPRPAFPLVVATVWFVVMMAAPLAGQRDMALRQYHYRFHDVRDAHTELLITEIEANTHPADRIFLWAYRPDVYWRTGRRMACRYLGTISAGGWSNPNNPVTPRIAAELRRNKPPLIEWHERETDRPAAAEFMRWLEDHYRPLGHEGLGGLWLRSDLP
jgi:hypothetical protein